MKDKISKLSTEKGNFKEIIQIVNVFYSNLKCFGYMEMSGAYVNLNVAFL